MHRRRCVSSRAVSLSDTESESDHDVMKCLSCLEDYRSRDAGTCKECYEEANETEEELKREIEELKAKVAFLRFWSPLDHLHNRSNAPCFTDVVLIASGDGPEGYAVPLPAHKAVLVSTNFTGESLPSFQSYARERNGGKRSGTIKISDVSFDALRAFVNYLYTAEACLDEQMAYDLLVLAEKYQVKHLKAHCEKFLISRLNWDNSIMNYTFAHQHNGQHMIDAALSVIIDNMDKLTKREEYMELVEKDPRLVVEIYEAYMSKQVNTAACKDCSVK